MQVFGDDPRSQWSYRLVNLATKSLEFAKSPSSSTVSQVRKSGMARCSSSKIRDAQESSRGCRFETRSRKTVTVRSKSSQASHSKLYVHLQPFISISNRRHCFRIYSIPTSPTSSNSLPINVHDRVFLSRLLGDPTVFPLGTSPTSAKSGC